VGGIGVKGPQAIIAIIKQNKAAIREILGFMLTSSIVSNNKNKGKSHHSRDRRPYQMAFGLPGLNFLFRGVC
jgi:hypothetical protein